LITSFCYFWWQQANAPVDAKATESKIFVIKRGEDVRTIAKRLQTEGLIRDPVAFFLYVRYGGLQQNIQSGDFRISPAEDMQTIANNLTHGTLDVWLTTLEGWRNEEIATKLSQELSIPEVEFLKVAKIGYMFPDTYLIPKDASATAVVNIFTDNFNNKVTANVVEKAKNQGFTLDQVVIIASLVEREAMLDEDRPLVASIILNRLKLGMKLDVDATVQYIVGYQSNEKSWWKRELTFEDLKLNSPYNTYLKVGLPPTPIANPGLEAILAVINAPETDYLYYVSDKNGKIHPAKTIEEHNNNVAKYVDR
ncbi:endolytic transglycosylase MltG, partial [Candidatus Gottesmanbacteria bacterium]|nr:endolytic transglycosylase MltG [Candidatus Gottesmanbacteria bacterium]